MPATPPESNPTDAAARRPPVVFGEVLYDIFPDGASVLGGAPFNVAWNLQGLGLPPLFISRVGDDSRGERVLEAMEAWGMETSGVQKDPARPTGAVEVELREGQPTFHILPDQAYDCIDGAEVRRQIPEGSGSLLYHGSLAVRSKASRSALSALLRRINAPVFVDVNLRPPWWERESVLAALRAARWAKLNARELQSLSGEEARESHEMEAAARRLRAAWDLEFLVVTEGAEGASIFRQNEEVLDLQPLPVDGLVDTVGAGDAFSAVIILGLERGWPVFLALRRAVEFAGFVCTLRGATSDDASLYRSFAERWEGEDRKGTPR